jgi:hypothetical protein
LNNFFGLPLAMIVPTPVFGDARAARADALRQRALGIELQLQGTGQELLGEKLVFAHVGRDHFLDLLGFQQDAETRAIDASVIGNDGQSSDAGLANRLDQHVGNAAQAKAARHDRHVVLQKTSQGGLCVGIEFAHGAARRKMVALKGN